MNDPVLFWCLLVNAVLSTISLVWTVRQDVQRWRREDQLLAARLPTQGEGEKEDDRG